MPDIRTVFVAAILGVWVTATNVPEPAPADPMPRLSIMLSPAPVGERMRTTGRVRETVLTKEADGHFWADAELDGHRIRLLVDTGASAVVLSEKDARKLGIPLHTLDYDGEASTANGEVETAEIDVRHMRVGSIVARDMRVTVTKGALDVSLLGMSFLGALKSFEFKGDSLGLRQ